MVLKDSCRMHRHAGGANIYLPSSVVQDSAFPFTVGDLLEVRIEGAKVTIRKVWD